MRVREVREMVRFNQIKKLEGIIQAYKENPRKPTAARQGLFCAYE